ncbi:hypothetical protein KM043_003192 [Ampulex compressa]|nr:hypothetical protein KM043_003192 [Ampulex compressa]
MNLDDLRGESLGGLLERRSALWKARLFTRSFSAKRESSMARRSSPLEKSDASSSVVDGENGEAIRSLEKDPELRKPLRRARRGRHSIYRCPFRCTIEPWIVYAPLTLEFRPEKSLDRSPVFPSLGPIDYRTGCSRGKASPFLVGSTNSGGFLQAQGLSLSTPPRLQTSLKSERNKSSLRAAGPLIIHHSHPSARTINNSLRIHTSSSPRSNLPPQLRHSSALLRKIPALVTKHSSPGSRDKSSAPNPGRPRVYVGVPRANGLPAALSPRSHASPLPSTLPNPLEPSKCIAGGPPLADQSVFLHRPRRCTPIGSLIRRSQARTPNGSEASSLGAPGRQQREEQAPASWPICSQSRAEPVEVGHCAFLQSPGPRLDRASSRAHRPSRARTTSPGRPTRPACCAQGEPRRKLPWKQERPRHRLSAQRP